MAENREDGKTYSEDKEEIYPSENAEQRQWRKKAGQKKFDRRKPQVKFGPLIVNGCQVGVVPQFQGPKK